MATDEGYRPKRWITAAVVLAWFALHAYFSAHRSMWVDEWARYDQMKLGLLDALKSLFSEISPFAPGEILLAWLDKQLFSTFLSDDLWMRLHSVYFGALTVWLACRSRLRFLIVPIVFSVALTAFATQFRPYSQLIFGGALAFYLIIKREKLDRIDQGLTWFGLTFGHIYGICFVGMASVFRRDWFKAVFAVLYVSAILAVHHHFKTPHVGVLNFPPLIETVKQSLGALGNPHKAAYFFSIFVVIGLATLFKRDRPLALKLSALLAASVLGPILATYAANYYFMPRQVVGGSFIFMGLAAIGLSQARHRFLSKSRVMAVIWVSVAICSIGPWLAYVRGVPPFIDQPMHKFKALAANLIKEGYRNVLWMDSGTAGSARIYFTKAMNAEPAESIMDQFGFSLLRLCWSEKSFCVYILRDSDSVWDKDKLLRSPDFQRLLASGQPTRFDALVHLLPDQKLNVPIRAFRAF